MPQPLNLRPGLLEALRRRLTATDGERGAAVIEFIAIGLTLTIPLVYAIVLMANVQQAMLATSSAAREVGRMYAVSTTRAEAEARAGTALQDMLRNYHYQPSDSRVGVRVRTSCGSGTTGLCTDGFGPGAEVAVEVTYQVPAARIPFIGLFLGNITVGSTHHTRVDRFRGLT
jgi:hypothetical protein